MVVLVALVGVVFPCACMVAIILIGRRYVAKCRDAANDAHTAADDVYAALGEVRTLLAVEKGDEPTEAIPRVHAAVSPDLDQALVVTRAQQERADAAGRHRLDKQR